MSSETSQPQEKRSFHSSTEQIQGIVERVTYHAEESGYTIARFKTPGTRDLVTIAGHVPAIEAGQTLRLFGSWREHPKYGPQFQVTHAQEMKPATLSGKRPSSFQSMFLPFHHAIDILWYPLSS